MKRAVIYARYSTDRQSDRSIEDQVRLCHERIEADGHTSTQVYSDHAISGATLLRPGIQALMEDASRGKFDAVYAEALDRISRDQEDAAGFYKRMRFAEVSMITLSEGAINDLHVGLKGTMNALFLKDLADKTRRGLRGRVEASRSGGGVTYGYDVVQARNPESEGAGQRSINEEEARVVVRIFRDYAGGKSPRHIAFELNKDGIAGPSGTGWGASTINGNAKRGTGILNNELYIGRLVWNRLRYVKDPDSGKRRSRLNPPDQWIIKGVPELRIVPQELWDRVKDRQSAVKRQTRPDHQQHAKVWERRRPRFLLSGLIKCGACGGGYTMVSRTLYGCANARNKGTCDNWLNIRRDALEATILDGLKRHLMDPELFKLFCEEFTKALNRLRGDRAAEHTRKEAELRTITSRLRRIVDAIAEGVPALTLKEELLSLETRKVLLDQEMVGWRDEPVRLHPNMAEVYRKKVDELALLLQGEDDKQEAFEAIRGLIDRIVLSPEHGNLKVDLHGELAAILRFSQASKSPAGDLTDRAEQLVMVAGVGFEPTTFRL
jgi:site-specific DNA recombinase